MQDSWEVEGEAYEWESLRMRMMMGKESKRCPEVDVMVVVTWFRMKKKD